MYAAVCLILSVITIVYISPSLPYILLFLLLISATVFSITSLFVRRLHSIILTVGIGIFLITSYLVGFQILNTILLISGIIGLIVLIKQSNL